MEDPSESFESPNRGQPDASQRSPLVQTSTRGPSLDRTQRSCVRGATDSSDGLPTLCSQILLRGSYPKLKFWAYSLLNSAVDSRDTKSSLGRDNHLHQRQHQGPAKLAPTCHFKSSNSQLFVRGTGSASGLRGHPLVQELHDAFGHIK